MWKTIGGGVFTLLCLVLIDKGVTRVPYVRFLTLAEAERRINEAGLDYATTHGSGGGIVRDQQPAAGEWRWVGRKMLLTVDDSPPVTPQRAYASAGAPTARLHGATGAGVREWPVELGVGFPVRVRLPRKVRVEAGAAPSLIEAELAAPIRSPSVEIAPSGATALVDVAPVQDGIATGVEFTFRDVRRSDGRALPMPTRVVARPAQRGVAGVAGYAVLGGFIGLVAGLIVAAPLAPAFAVVGAIVCGGLAVRSAQHADIPAGAVLQFELREAVRTAVLVEDRGR